MGGSGLFLFVLAYRVGQPFEQICRHFVRAKHNMPDASSLRIADKSCTFVGKCILETALAECRRIFFEMDPKPHGVEPRFAPDQIIEFRASLGRKLHIVLRTPTARSKPFEGLPGL